MKTSLSYLSVAFVLFFCYSLSGQEYTPFYLDNAKWTMEGINPVLGSGDGHAFWEVYTLDDTLVANEVYRKVAVRNLCELWPDPNGELQPNLSLNTNEFVLGGLREEDRKVYFLRFDQEPAWRLLQGTVNRFDAGEEYLLYDFDISVGDTTHYSDLEFFTVSNGDTSFFTSNHFTIIDEELQPLEEHRRYEIRSSTAFAYPFETGGLTEGIGSSYGLFGSYDSFLTYLTCFSVDGESMLVDGNCNPCDGLVSTRDLEEVEQIQVYPNPVQSVLHLRNTGGLAIEEIRIVDQLGRVLRRDKEGMDSEILRLDVSTLPAGMLLLEIIHENGKRQLEKIVVSH